MPKELCSRTSVLQVTYNQFDQDNYNLSQLFLFFFFFLSFVFWGPHPQHMEVPRLGVVLEL